MANPADVYATAREFRITSDESFLRQGQSGSPCSAGGSSQAGGNRLV